MNAIKVYKSEIELLENEIKEAKISGLPDIFFRFKESNELSILNVEQTDHFIKHSYITMASNGNNFVIKEL